MKICVSSSCKFEADWPKLKAELLAVADEVEVPEVQDITGLSQEEVDRVMETVNRFYYKQIDESDLVYVYCPNGYIGKGVAAEIGYSIAKGKEIIASENIEDLGIWAVVNKVMSIKELKKYLSEVANV